MKLLDRHIISEFAQILTVGTLVIVGIFFGTVEFKYCLDLAADIGIPLVNVLTVMVLQLPTGIMFCLPAGVLLSVMYVLIRKHQDSEIVALQAAGVPFWRVMAPFMAVGVISSAAAFAIGEFVAPQARYLSTKLLLAGACASERPFPARSAVEFRDERDVARQLLVFGQGAGRTVNGFLVLDMTRPEFVTMVWSRWAEWKSGFWVLRAGRHFELLNGDDGVKGKFGTMQLAGLSALWRSVDSAPKSNYDKTTAQLRAEIEKYRKSGKPVPFSLPVQLYRRYSQPVSCLLLVLAAAPVAFVRKRRETGLAMVYGGVLVVSFFLLQQTCMALGENGRLAPLVAAWLPASLLCLFGLLVCAIRRA